MYGERYVVTLCEAHLVTAVTEGTKLYRELASVNLQFFSCYLRLLTRLALSISATFTPHIRHSTGQ